MLNSFYTALSGLNANTFSLSVIGHNLANMNTVGYKANVASFQDILASSVLQLNGAGNPMQVGLGVMQGGVDTKFTQGTLETTGQPTDVAIVGKGFFVVSDGVGQYYTRAGNFSVDAEGFMVTQSGMRVQGYAVVNGQVDSNGALSDIRMDPGLLLQASTTAEFQIATNLDADMPVGDTFTTSVQVVDSLGEQHLARITFTRNATAPGAPPSFGFDITVEGGDVVGGTAGTQFSLLTGADAVVPPPGTMNFDAVGQLASVDPGTGLLAPAADFNITTPVFANGANAQTVNFDLVDDVPGTGYVTSYSAPSSTSSTVQDGVTAANLLSFSVGEDGTVLGIFANGKTAPLGQLATAGFNNPQGLVRLGDNLFAQAFNAGEPSIGVPGSGGRGSLTGGALELSNVDLASEFTKLILAQRGYQANSRMITTSDEILQEAINLKR